MDDGSKEAFKSNHRNLSHLDRVKYIELEQNIGRSAIRNRLGKTARFDYLLFLDCDSAVVTSKYIQNYLDHLHPATVLYGGRVYSARVPTDPTLFFHWKYGTKREAIAAKWRQSKPYHGFMTNNFIIPRVIFQRILFDESIRYYGNEDTLFGLALKQEQIVIEHLENPLEHLGLEPNEVFLQKSEQALQNLAMLYQKRHFRETRLLQVYDLLRNLRLEGFFLFFFTAYKELIRRHLLSARPKLWLFDVYKLGYFISLTSEDGRDNAP